MQIRCSTCTKTIAIAPTGVLPPSCPHCSQAAIPKRLGAYVLDRLIATGGMGEVYHAHHEELGTEVAIKLLPALPLDVIDSVRERFAREARLTAKVKHRGVVRVVSSDASGDRPYLVLELVSGVTLRHLLRDSALAPIEAARIVADTADVLAAAHQQGVLHRDIKPDNVMLEPDGSVRVLDFGIARAVGDDTPLTRTGEIIGTPEYMAPEQLLDGPEATDERTDVHALGVLLYELLTKKSPFRGANLFQSLKLVESLQPGPPSETQPELSLVVLRAIEKQASDRYATAAGFAEAIRTAVPESRTARPHSPPQTWPLWLAAVGVLIGIAGILFAVTLLQGGERSDAKPSTTVTRVLDADAVLTTTELRNALDQGHWCAAITDSEQALAEGNDTARLLAQKAFILSHAAWWRVAGLPPWLAAYDLGHRERLFGDLLEPGNGSTDTMRAMLCGDDEQWQRFANSRQAGPAITQLLELASQPLGTRADLLAKFATRLPIEQPEHWLARTIERHLRRDTNGASQAAEMAWLTGAGDMAILLDAALAMKTADYAQRQQLWRRLSKSDRADCPASTLLLLHLETLGITGVTFEPHMAHSLPMPHRATAASWFVQQARDAENSRKTQLLRIAAALAAVPDFEKEPWLSIPTGMRKFVAEEAKRAR
ncbi:MAG: hypothetical protein ACI89X_000882 [Planctomycetota bacterium]